MTAYAGLLGISGSPAAAQMPVQVVRPPAEPLPFDRPESWALAHFTSATLLSGLDAPATRTPGDVSIGLEFGWLPPLDATQRRVGFYGTKEEDLNKAPFVPRPRVSVGLPARFSVIVAPTPPVPMFGLKAALLAIGVERPVIETPRWTFGLRGYGQVGWVRGAFTCPAETVAFKPGSAANVAGCQARSSDTSSLHYAGGEASLAYRRGPASRFSPHAAFGVSYMDMEFQVDAVTIGGLDRTRLASHGAALTGSGGVSWRMTPRFGLAVDAFYSPLSVRRRPEAPVQTDGFFNVRALVTYRLR